MVSFVHQFFKSVAKDKASCQVNNCGKELSTAGGTTGSLLRHLEIKHNITSLNYHPYCNC